ncbi:MAG: SDR family NAD(P)-dependent oxidoreductase [Candidatus Latescibacteria bacterium]|nr:SDR family NAD(P)-dependent oxidoreductase [Candidatus Latescibacterota bacterium]
MGLNGKVAVITGAGRGIGQATALAFAREGVAVVLAAKTAVEIEGVARQVQELGVEALAVPADVADKGQVEALFERALSAYGQVDILVNNAGVAIHNPIEQIVEADWDLNIAVNLKGTFLCTQAVFAHMCQRGSGHIINVSSGSGKNGHVNGGAYCAAKFGVVGFTQVTEAEGRPHGVKASVVCPGPTETRMRLGNHPNDVTENLTKPEDIAAAILFVAQQPAQAHTVEVVVRTPLM